jgi:predicted alpha/beta superfamily hydrolase
MKKFAILFFVLISSISFSQIIKDTINSKKLFDKRELIISVPESFSKNPKKAYPLLLLLDGDYLFSAFDGAIKYGNYWDDLPEMIIVGISQNKNDERFDDCTVDPQTGLPEKKGAQFFEFIGGEVLPYIEQKYNIAPLKIIAGHDITAGFINFFLYKDKPLFNGYIAISPEMPAHMEEYIPQRLASFNNNIFYYHSSAGADLKVMKETSALLDQNIKAINNPKLNYQYDEFPSASHYSVVLFSIPNALYHFFDTFRPITTIEYKDKIVKLESGYVDYLKDKYDAIENSLGIKVPVRINDFRAIEAAINKNKATNEYEKLAQIANKDYPKTMLGEYYMARYYEENGDFKRASKSYQNAFTMEEIGDLTKNMMLDKADALRSQIKK